MRFQNHSRIAALVLVASTVLALTCLVSVFAVAESPASPHTITTIASTVPTNGDINPYGIFVVPNTVGNLVKGNLLISNFNAASNKQGTGTTIMQISPGGMVSQFAQIDASNLPGPCTGGVGLSTALVALRAGWVIVGSLPTTDGTAATATAATSPTVSPRTPSSALPPWSASPTSNRKTCAWWISPASNSPAASHAPARS